jgi:DNA (cytosine-5)-methyltransferase 1
MTAYYNENNPYSAEWLRRLIGKGLIADGIVDERSIAEVRPSDLYGYSQCHFFAGIGGWSYALRLAGWNDSTPVWTGSCPCQPFSTAARGLGGGTSSPKHLWPEWLRLISAIKPRTVFGEQVASSDAWFREVCYGMEESGYAFASAIIPAISVGKDHIRNRLYFIGHSNSDGESSSEINAETQGVSRSDSKPRRVVSPNGFSSRVARLRALGNAIVPQVAAEFIKSAMDCGI